MAFIHNILTVAHYEAKTLRRTWFFRLFSIGALIIFTLLNIGLFSPVGSESWELVSIPSSLPLINLYLLNIGQAIVVIFLASDFLKRDKKLDTVEVLYTRSMSNFEYVTGKTLGILKLFLSLNLIILGIGLIINIISKTMEVDILSYFEYLLIISLPTLLFSLGLAFIVMLSIGNQAITFFILLGYAALNMFYLWDRGGLVFDYMAFGLPAFKSEIIGFDNLPFILNQRLIYFCSGFALVMATTLMFKRLPQSKLQRQVAAVLFIITTAGAGVSLYNTLKTHFDSKSLKNEVISINRQFESKRFPSTVSSNIELVHKGKTIDVVAELKILNDNDSPLKEYLFSLNPGLTVSKVISAGKELKFKSTGHIIEIDPERELAPGAFDSVTVIYSGTILESFCYPNYSDNIKENRYRIAMVNVNKRQAFIKNNYVLLTPEAHWYPVSGLNYYPSNPARIKVDFTRFILRARSKNNLQVVSQGWPKESGGFYSYSPDFPLAGLTVAMGNYVADRITVDSVDFISWHYPGNDYYKRDFEELKDTLSQLISGFMKDIESGFGTPYPFKTLSLVEAPVQFYSYPKKNTQTRAEVQPSMVILPEKLSTLQQAGFSKRFARMKRQMARNNQIITDKELKVRFFNAFVRNTFLSGQNFRMVNRAFLNEPARYLLGPSFYFFRNNFYSDEYPVINAVFESHLQKLNEPARPDGAMFMSGNLSDNDKANLILKDISFRDLLAKNPGSDTLSAVLTLKGDYLFNLLRSKAGITEFNDWFKKYISDNRYKRVNILKLNEDIKERFGFEFYPYLDEWFNGKGQPGFLFTGIEASQIVIDQRTRYQVTFIASNPEAAGGLFNVAFRTGGGFGGRGGRMASFNIFMQTGRGGAGGGGRMMQMALQGRGLESADISKIIYLGPSQAKKIGIVLDNQPRAMQINTLYSKNIPGEISFTIEEIKKSSIKDKPFDGEESLPVIPPFTEPQEIIVDNEDQGFYRSSGSELNPLKRILGVKLKNQETYKTVNLFLAPEYWQPVVQNTFYGKYVRSSVYTRAGTGDRYITWKGIIKEPGYYDVYTYIGKAGERIMIRGAGGPGVRPTGSPGGGPLLAGDLQQTGPGGKRGQRTKPPYKDFHFKVYHDDGMEEIVIDYQTADPGWNKLGTYYLSPDTAKIELTNKSEGRVVIGDAVKWVIKQ